MFWGELGVGGGSFLLGHLSSFPTVWFCICFTHCDSMRGFFGCALGLHCCAQAFLSWDELWQVGATLVLVHRLLTVVASFVAEHRL